MAGWFIHLSLVVWYFFNIISVRCTYGIESVSIHVFIYPSIHPSIHPSDYSPIIIIHLPFNQSINQSINPIMSSPYLFIHVSIYPPAVYPSIHLHMDPSISPSIYLSIYEFIYLPIYLRARMYIYKYKYKYKFLNIHIYIYIYSYMHICVHLPKKCCIHTILAHYQLNLYFVFLVINIYIYYINIIMHGVRVSYARCVPLHGLKVRTSQSALLVLCGGPPKSGRWILRFPYYWNRMFNGFLLETTGIGFY